MANHIHGQHQASTHLLGRLSQLSSKHPAARTYIDRMRSTLSPLVAKTLALAEMADTPNPTLTDAANFERVARKLEVYSREATSAINANSQFQKDGFTAINTQADTRLKLNVKSDNHDAFMLRFANMSKAEIWREAIDALKKGDSEFTATILKAHPFLSGLSASDVERLRSDYVKTHAPDLSDAIGALNDAFEIALAVDRVAQNVRHTLANPERLAEIQRGVAAAEKAEASFNSPNVPE